MNRNRRDGTDIKGWVTLCCDVSWEDYGGTWAKKSLDGSWYVLKWTNLWDAAGESDDLPKYECEVKRINFGETPDKEIESALRSCGYSKRQLGNGYTAIVADYSGDIVADGDNFFPCLVDACISYGLGAPLESFTGNVHARRIRAEAKRYAELCMKDAELLNERLDRPVNAIGSTAREYGVGDITAGLHREPFDEKKKLMRRLSGLATAPITMLKQSDLRKCPFCIIMPEHYRPDGTCKCDDAEHRAMMIRDWEYTEDQFANIPLRRSP